MSLGSLSVGTTFLDVMCRTRGDLHVMIVHGVNGGPEMSMMGR